MIAFFLIRNHSNIIKKVDELALFAPRAVLLACTPLQLHSLVKLYRRAHVALRLTKWQVALRAAAREVYNTDVSLGGPRPVSSVQWTLSTPFFIPTPPYNFDTSQGRRGRDTLKRKEERRDISYLAAGSSLALSSRV